ncbi:MAG: acetyl/propionyl/methylcrotonyl-CoA carboxylase subunit alpha [Actinomycetota bacterium]
MFESVLVANRGEIACRILRTLRELAVRGVAVYSEADAGAKHVREADHAELIGEAPAPASYLNPAAIVDAALRSGAGAVHPGYGFLSESPKLAEAVVGAGLSWIGPPPDVLELAGDKVACRNAFEKTGFPVLPAAGPLMADEAIEGGREVGFPVMVKAVSGGGGIGMGVARNEAELAKAVETASTRGARFFADPSVYLERYVEHARHIEVQVLFDTDGRGVHLYERECSVQRRHQKVVEETPSPAVDRELRERLCDAALESMRAIGYVNAGTVECVLTPEREFFFLEVNARLQVEHPVTEMTTGVDLVAEQLRIASGAGMSLNGTPDRSGHSLECRVYAEDPRTFLPAPGRIAELALEGPGVDDSRRFDLGYGTGDDVPMFYDPLIGKVVIRGEDRSGSVASMLETLRDIRIDGLKTNVPALVSVMEDERFVSGHYDTGLLGR